MDQTFKTSRYSPWPTPMAGTPAQKGYNEAGNNDSSRKVVELCPWPTPAATDEKIAGGRMGKEPRQEGAEIERSRRTPWSELEWLDCTDGKARPTKSGIFPLAHGVSARMGKLRAAGNAIVPQVAAEFIKAVMAIL